MQAGAGDFSSTAYEVVRKRPGVLGEHGKLTIDEVNDYLDRLNRQSKEWESSSSSLVNTRGC